MAMTVGFMAPAANAQSYQGGSAYQGQAYGYNQADPNCRQRKATNGVVGALVGGALGVVLGNNVYARSHKDDGRIVGGIAGAGLGAAIGAGGTNCNTNTAYQGGYNNGYANNAPPPAPPPSYGDRSGYNNGQYNDRGGYNDRYEDELAGGPNDRYAPPPSRVYAQNRGYASQCRVVDEMRRDRYGRPYRVPQQVCRDPYSGEWVVTR
jgi:hypothetical protein